VSDHLPDHASRYFSGRSPLNVLEFYYRNRTECPPDVMPRRDTAADSGTHATLHILPLL